MKKIPFIKTILYEDDDYFVVNKPAMLATLADRQMSDHMLMRAKKYCPTAQVCHRLDKGTSGVLAFAKHPAAYQHLTKQFQDRTVEKHYHAIAEGIHTFKDHVVDLPITVQSSHRSVIDRQHGKRAITHFDTLQHFTQHTLLLCRPLTGKSHQIRLHAACQKAPLAGDATYGGHLLYLSTLKKNYRFSKEKEERPLMARAALHALKLRFQGMHDQPIIVEAPYPKDFKATVRQLSVLSDFIQPHTETVVKGSHT
ncbi:MAG: pseudouridine synthase [Bacteroidota bacterium]